MRIKKSVAGVAAGALVLTGIGFVTASSASAAAPGTLTCNTSGNSAAFASQWNDTNTFDFSTASVAQGTAATLTWTSATGLNNGSPATLAAGSVQVQVVAELSGAMTGTVVLKTASGQYPSPVDFPTGVPSGVDNGPITATASFTTPSNVTGTVNATVKEIIFNSATLDTYCSTYAGTAGPPATGNYPLAGDPAITSTLTPYTTAGGMQFTDGKVAAAATTFGSAAITVNQVPQATIQSVTGQTPFVPAARVGDTVNVSLANFSNGAPTTAELCAYNPAPGAPLAGCVAQTLNSGATTAAASVVLSNVTATGAPYYLALGNGTDPKSRTFIAILGDRTVTLSPANGPVGSTLYVSGSNWNPTQAVSIQVLDSAGDPIALVDPADVAIGTSITRAIGNSGAFNTAVAAGAELAAPIKVAANFQTVRVSQSTTAGPETVDTLWEFLKETCNAGLGVDANPDATCSTQQEAKVLVTPGDLVQEANQTGGNDDALSINFPDVETSTTGDTVNGTFNTVTVTDARGGTSIWSLTASLTSIPGQGKVLAEVGGGSGEIDGSNLYFTNIGCGPQAGSNSAPGVTIGVAGTTTGGTGLAGTQTLCTKTATQNANGSTSGVYDITGLMSLDVPAYTKAVAYSGVVQVTLA
jgi:hypothetical protein